jgi:hypothetical protein
LFRSPDQDQMGAGDDFRDLTLEQKALAEALSLEWLERIADRAPVDSDEAVQAGRMLEIHRDPEKAQAMGRGNILREALKTLAHVPWLARPGMYLTERFFVSALTQVTRYLTDDAIRARMQGFLQDLVVADTRVLIGHSLGSVVAYEHTHSLKHPLRLLLTIGSPLGLRTIVTERLRPPPSFPPKVTVWLNAANREDVVAAEPNLRPLFAQDVPVGSRFDGIWFDEACANPHDPTIYLGRKSVGRAIIEALA